MKQLLAFFTLIVPIVLIGQNSFVDRNRPVSEYQNYVNNLKDTTMVIINNEKFTEQAYDGGSKLIGVFYNNKLVKISSWFGLSYGINSCDYYLKNEELYFVKESFQGYKYNSEKSEYNYSDYDIYANGIYLFKNKILIDTESLGHWRFEDDTIDPEKELISEFREYKKILINKLP